MATGARQSPRRRRLLRTLRLGAAALRAGRPAAGGALRPRDPRRPGHPRAGAREPPLRSAERQRPLRPLPRGHLRLRSRGSELPRASPLLVGRRRAGHAHRRRSAALSRATGQPRRATRGGGDRPRGRLRPVGRGHGELHLLADSFGLSPWRPVWRPDGQGITVGAKRGDRFKLLTFPATGAGRARARPRGGEPRVPVRLVGGWSAARLSGAPARDGLGPPCDGGRSRRWSSDRSRPGRPALPRGQRGPLAGRASPGLRVRRARRRQRDLPAVPRRPRRLCASDHHRDQQATLGEGRGALLLGSAPRASRRTAVRPRACTASS